MSREDVFHCFRVLYTRHLTKKQKTYHDGFLKVTAKQIGVLFDDEGRQLSSARLRAKVTAESEGIGSFRGFLVNCDEVCELEEVPKPEKRPSNETQPKREQSSPPRIKFAAPTSRVGLKKRRASNEEVDQTKKPRPDSSQRNDPRTDEEILNLFLQPEKEVETEKVERASGGVEAVKESVDGEVKHKPFKRPSMKQRSEGGQFDGECMELRFLLFGKKTERQITIPDGFASRERYTQAWKAALHEELQLKLDAFAMKMRMSLKALEEERGKKALAEKGSESSPIHTTAWLRKSGIEYHDGCRISVFKKEKREEDLFFVEIRNLMEETKKASRKHDLWIVSSDPVFLFKRASQGRRIIDRIFGPWIAVFGSMWHGVSKEGKIQLELMSKQRPWLSCDNVYVIHGPSAGLEMTVWDAMAHVENISESLMNALITKPSPSSLQISSHESCPEVDQMIERFHLNEDQASVARFAAQWSLEGTQELKDTCLAERSPVCLIHGPFGTGKSSLLVAIIHLLTSSHNEAVDRIMEGLLKSGYTDLLRVGLLDKISRPVLPYSIYYASESNDDSSTAAELKRQLQKVQSPSEEAILRQELQEVEQGIVYKRREKLSSAHVVGVTCCSANSSVLQGLTFDVVILDEACQIIEPLSVLPLIKTEARYLIAAGDPCQLSSVVAQPKEPATGAGFARAMFRRLQSLGQTPHMLRTQYRCHPDLCRVPNQHFYDGKLINGCSHDDRKALIPEWPAACHVQVKGTAMKSDNSHSYWNNPEALAITRVIQKVTSHGVADDQVGVICIYRAQVKLISSLLAEKADSIQVATVDSFQGMEKDIILLSMSVDAAGSFASDDQRLNVALTRAKHHLITVGDSSILCSISPCMQSLLQESKTISV